MNQERITTVQPVDGGPATTHTTIVRESEPRRSGGGAGWLIAIVLILALAVGGYILTQTSASEVARDNAIAGAANEVGEAAGAVGDAASNVGNAAQEAVDSVTE